MTQQNTTEKDHGQNRYNDAGQEIRPHKKHRRRKSAAEDRPCSTHRPEPAKEAQNTVPQPGTQNTVLETETTQHTAPQTEPAQETSPRAKAAQDSVSLTKAAQEPEDRPIESPAAAPEATIAENINYQAAYQEIYRDILENLRSFSPSDQVACSITEEHISEYLSNSHAEKVMQFKERREKRFFAALELIAVLAAVVLVIHYLQNNSAILVNILYIIAGLGALFLWKFQPRNDDRPNSGSDKEAK